METIPNQKRPFFGLKVHSFTQNMRPFPYSFVMLLQFDTSNHQAILDHCCQNYRDETLKFRSFEFNTNSFSNCTHIVMVYTLWYWQGVICYIKIFLLKEIFIVVNCQGISQSSRGRDSSTCSERIISSGLLTFSSGSNDYNCNCLNHSLRRGKMYPSQ
jgi:hypothetical protein